MRRTPLNTTLLGIALAGLTLTGCSSTKAPKVSVAEATMGESTDHAATVRLLLQLDNPNDNPVELLEFTYQVHVDGKPVYDGTRAAQMTLARESTRVAEVPAVIPFSKLDWTPESLPREIKIRVQGHLRYLAPGTFEQTLFDTGVKRPKTPFEGTKTVSLQPPTTQAAAR